MGSSTPCSWIVLVMDFGMSSGMGSGMVGSEKGSSTPFKIWSTFLDATWSFTRAYRDKIIYNMDF